MRLEHAHVACARVTVTLFHPRASVFFSRIRSSWHARRPISRGGPVRGDGHTFFTTDPAQIRGGPLKQRSSTVARSSERRLERATAARSA